MNKYFRVTVYHPKENLCAIIDSNGYFTELWELSAFCVQYGFNILEVGDSNKFIDVNIEKAEQNTESLFLRACATGKPEYICHTLNGREFKAVTIADKQFGNRIYIPNKE